MSVPHYGIEAPPPGARAREMTAPAKRQPARHCTNFPPRPANNHATRLRGNRYSVNLIAYPMQQSLPSRLQRLARRLCVPCEPAAWVAATPIPLATPTARAMGLALAAPVWPATQRATR